MNFLLGLLTFLFATLFLLFDGSQQGDTKNTFKFALFLSKCIFLVLLLLGFYEGFQSGLANNNQIKIIFGIIGITLTLVYCVWKSYKFFKKINDDF